MDSNRFQRIAKALADPRRFEILEVIIAGGEMCCGEVVERFPVAQATVSHHLKELTDAGLIRARQERQFKYLCACPDVLAEYVEQLGRRISPRRDAARRARTSRAKRAAKG